MAYGVKCHTCGLAQLPGPACKKCGAALAAPPETPVRAPSKTPSRAPSSALSGIASEVSPRVPPRVPTSIPSEAFPGVPSEAPPTVPSEDRTPRRQATGTNYCSQCGMEFLEDDLIRLGNNLLCAKCKPSFVQRLREGVAPAEELGELVYAGFWIRLGAKIIDGIILGLGDFVLALLLGLIARQDGTGAIFMGPLLNVLTFGFNLIYVTYFLGKYSATPGKMACGLKVVRPDGEKITYARACGRFFAELVSSITLAIGYIMAAFDDEKRALHDRICDTRVIRT